MLHFLREEYYVSIFISSTYTICRILHKNAECSLFHRVASSLAPADGVEVYASWLLVKEFVMQFSKWVRLPYVLKLAKASHLATFRTA